MLYNLSSPSRMDICLLLRVTANLRTFRCFERDCSKRQCVPHSLPQRNRCIKLTTLLSQRYMSQSVCMLLGTSCPMLESHQRDVSRAGRGK